PSPSLRITRYVPTMVPAANTSTESITVVAAARHLNFAHASPSQHRRARSSELVWLDADDAAPICAMRRVSLRVAWHVPAAVCGQAATRGDGSRPPSYVTAVARDADAGIARRRLSRPGDRRSRARSTGGAGRACGPGAAADRAA